MSFAYQSDKLNLDKKDSLEIRIDLFLRFFAEF